MKRIGLALLVILLLIFLIWNGYRDASPDIAAEFRYKVEDVRDVAHIELLDHFGQEIALKRNGDYWILNDSFRVRDNAISNLLDAIGRIELQVIPGAQALNTLVKDLTTHGVRTRLYDKDNQLLKGYVIGGSTPDDRGNYIIMEGADRPAVVHIPGWEGVLQTRYSMPLKDWKDRIIFRSGVDEIEELAVTYPEQEESSFVIRSRNGKLVVSPQNDSHSPGPSREGAAEAYLRSYGSVGAEEILPYDAVLKAIQGQTPFVTFDLRKTNGEEQVVKLFPIQVTADVAVRDRIERFYAVTDRKEAYLVQQLVFKDLFWGIDSFFQE